MKKIRNILPLLAAVVAIVVAIVVIENPFGGDEQPSDGGVVVVDAPEGQAVDQTDTLGTVVPTAEPTETPAPGANAKVADGPQAPEVIGINAWINSQPVKISDLLGKVVLVDFWTYTCVNCIRTLPYLKVWHSKYADDGLVILGVHTPEFKFEEELENVRQAVKDNGIGWTVGLDNGYETWRSYKNRYWPAKYLIDKDGIVRYTHFGEGAYEITEMKIRELLEEAGSDLSQIDPVLPEDQDLDPSFLSNPGARPTRELYGGWERGYSAATFGPGYVWHREYYQDRDTTMLYQDPGNHEDNQIYLHGPWHNGPESLQHGRRTPGFEDHMALRFSAKSVNAVFKPVGDEPEPYKILVTLDGEPLTESNKGGDVAIEEDGRSFIYVNEPKMYSIVQAPSFDTYELVLSSDSPQFALFAFTFGVYESGV